MTTELGVCKAKERDCNCGILHIQADDKGIMKRLKVVY